MEEFRVCVKFQVRGYYTVKAESLKEAIRKVEECEPPYEGRPTTTDMVDDTFEIDADSMKDEYGKDWKSQ